MELKKLFEMQRVLDERIVKEKGVEGQDLMPDKILALQTELCECANEWRGFKFWSEDRRPRTQIVTGDILVQSDGYELEVYRNPLLEEYVDSLHFALSIGLEMNIDIEFEWRSSKRVNITEQFLRLTCDTAGIRFSPKPNIAYLSLVNHLIGLGEMLGFEWGEIEDAYMDKNAVNHTRQDSGY